MCDHIHVQFVVISDLHQLAFHLASLLQADWERARQNAEWEDARKRCMIISHPLYAGLLQTHAACLCVGTPVDQIPDIQEQLSHAPMIAEKYKLVQERFLDCTQEEQDDLNHCMVIHLPIAPDVKRSLSL